jgi:hypothetical protein
METGMETALMLAAAVLATVAVIAAMLWSSWDALSGTDVSFPLVPVLAALFILARWHDQALPITLGTILLLVAIYSAYRLRCSKRSGPPGGHR